MKLLARLSFDIENQGAANEDVVRASKLGEVGKNKINKQGHLQEAMHTYRHDLLLVRAAMLVRRFPLTQRGRLRDISVGVNGG